MSVFNNLTTIWSSAGKSLFLLFLFQFLVYSELSAEDDWMDHIHSLPKPDAKNSVYQEQISCNPENCTKLIVDSNHSNEDIQERVYELMSENAGKISVEIQEDSTKIGSPENSGWVEFLREIAKRDGSVVFEPYYIGIRSMFLDEVDLPLFGDVLKVGYTIFSRTYSYFAFTNTKNYNAKILYHPESKNILTYYFVHKDYGSLCDTVFSQCNVIPYLDDDIFDMQLAEALKKQPANDILVRFDDTEAILPMTPINLDSILSMNQSSRIYKWLIAAKDVERKSIKRERFMTLQATLTLIDYSITAYDYIQALRMYSHARDWKAVAQYQDSEKGMILKSIEFRKIPSED